MSDVGFNPVPAITSAVSQALGLGGAGPLSPGLQQASWRGVPFAVRTSDGAFGRRVVDHQYPYRDVPYVEDLGRAGKKINFLGFLITDSLVYGGGDVADQYTQMVAACETEGPGTLVHPTLGSLQVCLGSSAVFAERWDAGRYIEIQFQFIEAGQANVPATDDATNPAVQDGADGLDTAAASDFSAAITPLLPLGGLTIQSAIDSVTSWGSALVGASLDASSLLNLASQLAGPFGRDFNAASAGFLGGMFAQVLPISTTIDELAAGVALARALVTSTVGDSEATAGRLGLPGSQPADLATEVQASVAAVLSTCANPGDAIRLIANLLDYADQTSSIVTGPIGDLHRRALCAALARASAAYQPSSYDDAAGQRAFVTQILDAEIDIAGDEYDDATFNALRTLRTAVVQDLIARGADLAAIAAFEFSAPLPSLVLANRIYRDGTRADQLVSEADPPHPLFMPTAFQALAN